MFRQETRGQEADAKRLELSRTHAMMCCCSQQSRCDATGESEPPPPHEVGQTYVQISRVGSTPAWKLQLAEYIHAKGQSQSARARPPCDWCGMVRRGISARRCCVCAACRATHYCSWQCMHEAWAGGHWSACGPATKMRESDAADVCRVVEDEA